MFIESILEPPVKGNKVKYDSILVVFYPWIKFFLIVIFRSEQQLTSLRL